MGSQWGIYANNRAARACVGDVALYLEPWDTVLGTGRVGYEREVRERVWYENGGVYEKGMRGLPGG